MSLKSVIFRVVEGGQVERVVQLRAGNGKKSEKKLARVEKISYIYYVNE